MQGNTDEKLQERANDMARPYPVYTIFGIEFSKMNMKETVSYLTDRIQQRETTHVITGNPIMVMAALEDPDYYRYMANAELIVPDGAGIVWSSERSGDPVKERVAGFDLMHELLRVGENYRWSVYLLGTSQDTIEEAARQLQLSYPLIKIVGCRDGFFGPNEDAKVVEQIREANPDILLVARGLNNQEPWIGKYKQELNVPVVMGVGGSLDIIAGKMKRAPVWMQKTRLEWFYRLAKQPTRAMRMLALPKFVWKVVRAGENASKRP